MRKIISFIIVLGLSAITVFLRFIITPILNHLSGMKRSPHDRLTVSGKVIAIENGILNLKESEGQTFKVAATDGRAKGMRVGDQVIVTRV